MQYQRGVILLMLVVGGCGSSIPTAPLSTSVFRSPTPATQPIRNEAPSPALANSAKPSVASLSPATTQPVYLFDGSFQTVGALVSEVNGYPIYANRLVRQLRSELSAEAKKMTDVQFRKFTTDEIRKKLSLMQRDELIFGAADRYLELDDRRLAEAITMQFRSKLITDAGGSIEMARQLAEESGDTFEGLLYDKYRKYMSDVYMRKKIYPRIQISAENMRAYYNQNLEREFVEQETVTFRMIKIDTSKPGGKDNANKRAAVILEKAKSADFEELARTMNDNPYLARAGGKESYQRGASKYEKVEAALWLTPIGQITGIIEDLDGLYIAKVESRTTRRVMPFEDRAVQDRIWGALWRPQFRAMAEEMEQGLKRNSMVRPMEESETNKMLQPAIDMAMQSYPKWAKGMQ